MPPAREDGTFVRGRYAFRGRLSTDGSTPYPAEPGRYHLYVSLACPWAHRALIVRKLLGLEEAVSVSVVDPVRDERGWAFSEPDPVEGFSFLSEAYHATDPTFSERYTVPVLWDKGAKRIVSNNFPDITLDFELQLAAFHRPGAPDLYPEALRPEIDALSAVIYDEVNDGVYRAGFATTQEAYEAAVGTLFSRLEGLETLLETRRYLLGAHLTEADIRLFPTLVRFDAVYFGHFKCSLRRLVDYPNLWAYARDLYALPGVAETVDFDHIKRHYYLTHPRLNPTRIVPVGPAADWAAPHGREALGA